jgi:hypothetical protein
MTALESDDVRWEATIWGLEPKWTREPDLEGAKKVLSLLGVVPGTVDISFLAQGGFNKIYDVASRGNETDLILRVALPVDPEHKTRSEVATMEWVRCNTDLPVPTVINYQANKANPVTFEWILMTKMPGKPLDDEVWRSIPYPAKEELVKRFAEYSSCVFKKQLSGVGNIYSADSPKVGRIVSMIFFWGDNIHQDVNRGPFSSSREWIKARLTLCKNDSLSKLAKYSNEGVSGSDEEDDQEDAQRTLEIVNRLTPLVDQILPLRHLEAETSMLFHDDLNRHNVFVDDCGALTAKPFRAVTSQRQFDWDY